MERINLEETTLFEIKLSIFYSKLVQHCFLGVWWVLNLQTLSCSNKKVLNVCIKAFWYTEVILIIKNILFPMLKTNLKDKQYIITFFVYQKAIIRTFHTSFLTTK